MYRVLIVEDEADAAETLRGHLERFGAAHGVEFSVRWLKTAFDFISEGGKFDLVFLDIDLPGINGMEAAQLMRTYDEVTPIIFVTNLAQYAVRGYEVDALDFMVKPVGYYDFSLRMEKALRKLRANVGRTIPVSTADGVRVVPLARLDYVEVRNHELIFHIADEEPLRVRGNLSAFERENAGGPLLRISKSVLVNMERIDWVRGYDLRTLSGDMLRISRSLKRSATDQITTYLGGSR
ncbi:LytR/AlgR family response regulator transcription factor [Olsenella profusa]|uniref:Response regulator transcription factor n=1 Tax=Olsenella profusa TaxID=138595 RepID=A0ABS2F1X2_9ACTN|nr:LytTR family DNA-binding domain-containing protein [Olsenella profusa]MBM6774567.1 response regulator transcription factor [Olsenella profusa]